MNLELKEDVLFIFSEIEVLREGWNYLISLGYANYGADRIPERRRVEYINNYIKSTFEVSDSFCLSFHKLTSITENVPRNIVYYGDYNDFKSFDRYNEFKIIKVKKIESLHKYFQNLTVFDIYDFAN